MKEDSRKIFLDRLRVAATLAVVLLHTVTGTIDTVKLWPCLPERRLYLVILDLVCWCVPVFILISGYLFLNPEREISFRQMVVKYCRRIVLALIVFGVPYACIELAAEQKSFSLPMLLQAFGMVLRGQSWSHLWYLYMILALYLMTPALKWLLGRLPRKAVYVFLALLFVWSSLLPFLKNLFGLEQLLVLPGGGIYLFYYICGYLFASYDGQRGQRGEKGSGMRILTLCILLLGAGMMCSRLFGSYTVQMAYNYPFTVLLSLCLFSRGLLRQREGRFEKENTGSWRKAGALCFAVYLIHPVFVNLYYKFLHISPLDFNLWISLPLFYAAVLLPAILAAWLLNRITVLRRYVL
jgi:surface polysaccharide O-acyltransferase-like enzyme